MKRLNFVYYCFPVMTILIYVVAYLLTRNGNWIPIAPSSTVGMVMQYVALFLVIGGVPFGLWWHKRTCKKLSTVEDKEQQSKQYDDSACQRIVIVSLGMPICFFFYFMLGGYQTMLWLTAIAAIGWYFTKPTEGKKEQELTPEDPNIPTY